MDTAPIHFISYGQSQRALGHLFAGLALHGRMTPAELEAMTPTILALWDESLLATAEPFESDEELPIPERGDHDSDVDEPDHGDADAPEPELEPAARLDARVDEFDIALGLAEPEPFLEYGHGLNLTRVPIRSRANVE